LAAAGVPGLGLAVGVTMAMTSALIDANNKERFEEIRDFIHARNQKKKSGSNAAYSLQWIGWKFTEASDTVRRIGGMAFCLQRKNGNYSPWVWSGVSQNLSGTQNERFVCVSNTKDVYGNFKIEYWINNKKVW
jgi:hypothetical protein